MTGKEMRTTDFYKSLDSYKACAYAEGFCEGEGASEEDQLIAWQWIYDTGLWRQLQGSYGRMIFNTLIPQGFIQK